MILPLKFTVMGAQGEGTKVDLELSRPGVSSYLTGRYLFPAPPPPPSLHLLLLHFRIPYPIRTPLGPVLSLPDSQAHLQLLLSILPWFPLGRAVAHPKQLQSILSAS